ncbi:NUDIX hydrolase [Cesiribacter andamanensis]|uniref:Uncharacterized protein n=1 Tax=Cesiribacter andamanensis AMV16 TaxID=1279009 RepID=M7NG50_9BACT|nr:hypothetical protein [Cesiribacter andamanensis]EMR00775.1 hypothetical protein ADICEAN_04109 [Cesiribacter andamanensis AMV16]
MVQQLQELEAPLLESPEYRHLLSHQRLHVRFFHFKVDKVGKKQASIAPPHGLV